MIFFENAKLEMEQAQTDKTSSVYHGATDSARLFVLQTVYSFFSRRTKSGLREKFLSAKLKGTAYHRKTKGSKRHTVTNTMYHRDPGRSFTTRIQHPSNAAGRRKKSVDSAQIGFAAYKKQLLKHIFCGKACGWSYSSSRLTVRLA